MLVLFETAAGYAVFKMLKPKKLKNVDSLAEEFSSAESSSKIVNLIQFSKFKDSAEALKSALSINDGKMDKKLKSLIKKSMQEEAHSELLVLDSKLGSSIKDHFTDLNIVSNSAVLELIRCIRGQTNSLIPALSDKEATAMSLGVGHNLSRYHLKFSPDKVDTMVVQAIGLLDELDKELNNYVMRVREWYGWHFPELTKIITDNGVYIDFVLKVGMRENAKHVDMTEFMESELAERVAEASEVSMGCEISEFDLKHLLGISEMVKSFTEYRANLHAYICKRMRCLCPNTSALVGEVIGARLLAHAGSLTNLAKYPASTVQLIGAEKALFRALKSKKSTPKYGLIYHAELVSKSQAKDKGKMARMLAAKVSLGARVDALSEKDETPFEFSIQNKSYLNMKLEEMKTGVKRKISRQSKHFTPKQMLSGDRTIGYDAGNDSAVPDVKPKVEEEEVSEEAPTKKKKKDKKRKDRSFAEEGAPKAKKIKKED